MPRSLSATGLAAPQAGVCPCQCRCCSAAAVQHDSDACARPARANHRVRSSIYAGRRWGSIDNAEWRWSTHPEPQSAQRSFQSNAARRGRFPRAFVLFLWSSNIFPRACRQIPSSSRKGSMARLCAFRCTSGTALSHCKGGPQSIVPYFASPRVRRRKPGVGLSLFSNSTDHVGKATLMLARTISQPCRRTSSRISELVSADISFGGHGNADPRRSDAEAVFLHAAGYVNCSAARRQWHRGLLRGRSLVE